MSHLGKTNDELTYISQGSSWEQRQGVIHEMVQRGGGGGGSENGPASLWAESSLSNLKSTASGFSNADDKFLEWTGLEQERCFKHQPELPVDAMDQEQKVAVKLNVKLEAVEEQGCWWPLA